MANGTTVQQLRERSDAELTEFVSAKQKELLDARFKNYTSQLMDTSSVAKLRKEIARGMSVQRERVNAKKAGA
ncbi:MAG: 50S ribosomal protein L29 [Polyangiales bacterium]